ncbi:hypothetical protein F5884DRAFT_664757 [Xylogone sp. PMI_703]|nr:hypothetical protein F5884DRAFT_664757 [Xylogone sp. PMI_703]
MGGYEWGQLGPFSAELDNERAMAVIRGAQAAAKRVPPKSVLDSFEKVDITKLSNEDRTCTICYNEFGVENPEGLIESPVRLPKCRHVFGDHCIKKWFEEQDTCPYCRDKLPSEPIRAKLGQMDRLRFYRMAGGMK